MNLVAILLILERHNRGKNNMVSLRMRNACFVFRQCYSHRRKLDGNQQRSPNWMFPFYFIETILRPHNACYSIPQYQKIAA